MTIPIPEAVLSSIEEELNTINFGKLTLEISIQNKIPKFRIIKEISIKLEENSAGQQIKNINNNKIIFESLFSNKGV